MVKLGIGTLLVALSLGPAGQGEQGPVGKFVHGIHGGDNTFGAAKRIAALEDAETLVEMLKNPAMAPHWPNITMLIGVSGQSAMARPLIDFAEGRNSNVEWSLPVYRGRTSAITALGYLVHEAGGDQDVMDYLTKSIRPGVWAEREVEWILAHPEQNRLSVQLSSSAITALALTGEAQAGKTLTELTNSENRRLREMAEAMLPEWEEISSAGLTAYYERERKDGPVAGNVSR